MALPIAILSAKGIGDALLMMICAYQFYEKGYKVTFFHPGYELLKPLFPWANLLPYPQAQDLADHSHQYECIIMQNDNSSYAYELFQLRRESRIDNLLVFFSKPSKEYLEQDFMFNSSLSMVQNIAQASANLLGNEFIKKDNGIYISANHIYKRYPSRILFHPTSANEQKNWPIHKYLRLANYIEEQGYFPQFIMSAQEKIYYQDKIKDFPIVAFDSLLEASHYIYESGFFIGNDSGLGHLASNMQIPTLTIAGNAKQIQLWRPDWSEGKIVNPPFLLPNFKGLKFAIRDKYWQKFISVKHVLKAFKKMSCKL